MNKTHEFVASPWGADADLALSHQHKSNSSDLSITQKGCCALIRGFQNFISPIDGPRSNFTPTSSQYTFEAIKKYGVFMGIVIGCDRLMRENSDPWVYPIISQNGVRVKFDPIR